MINDNQNVNANSGVISNTNKPPYIIPVKFQINKLIKTLEYNYQIEIADAPGNWPVVAIPKSGSFVSDSRSRDITTIIMFCPNTGVCNNSNPDVLPYNINYSRGFNNKDLLFTNLRLKVNEKNTTDYLYSSGQYIECLNCLKSCEVSFSGEVSLNKETKNITNVSTSISKLVAGQEYFWSFNNNSSNWPATISPISGSFIASTEDHKISSVIEFCKDISCSGSNGYLNYTEDSSYNRYKYLNLNFTINSNDHCYFDNSDHNLFISCDDCLSYPSIDLNPKSLSFSDNCKDLEVSISGLDPYQGYNYYFSTHSANWPATISPISGSFITSNNTSLAIPFKISFCGSEALCSGDPNLITYDIDYNKLYTNTSCEKYAYIQYNLLKMPNFTIQNNNLLLPSNPITQSEIVKASCQDCLGSQVIKIDNKINMSTIPTATGSPQTITPTGTGTIL